jgi:hypothetical protein
MRQKPAFAQAKKVCKSEEELRACKQQTCRHPPNYYLKNQQPWRGKKKAKSEKLKAPNKLKNLPLFYCPTTTFPKLS